LLLLVLLLRVMRNANDVRCCHQIRKCAKTKNSHKKWQNNEFE